MKDNQSKIILVYKMSSPIKSDPMIYISIARMIIDYYIGFLKFALTELLKEISDWTSSSLSMLEAKAGTCHQTSSTVPIYLGEFLSS